MSDIDHHAWYAGKTFTTDWTMHHVPTWLTVLGDRRDAVDILEIGAWEGRSAVFWLNFCPRSRLTCIDSFAGGQEHHLAHADKLRGVEQRFDANVAEFAGRVEKVKAASADALSQLGVTGRRFDFVYVDGGHRAVDAYSDAALAWPMVRPGGAMMFDDYTWAGLPDELDRPKLGIDAFLLAIAGSYRELHRELQILIEKLPPPGATTRRGG